MAFPSEFLDRLRQLVPLTDTVARKVRLTRRGREFTGLCPFHNEKTPSFTVSDDKGFYHCFGCGAHGDVIGFVMRTEGLSFPEAVEKLANEAGLALPRSSPEEQARERRRADLHEVVEAACAWFEEQLAESRSGAEARAYLERRGVNRATREAFRLGYAPDRRGALRQALNARGIGDDQLAAAGLIKQPEDGGAARDYFFDRVIFPITDRRGRVIAFGGRALGDSPAKYLNSPDSELFHKGRVLYNLARARQAARDGGELVVCEGYMDVIALAQAGFPAAVAPLGTAVTPEQIQELWRLAAEPVICLDGDEAGRRAGYRLIERALPLLKPGVSLRFALLPAGEDPDSLVQAQGARAFRELLDGARPLAELLWTQAIEGRRLDTPERRAGLRRDLLAAVQTIADRSVQGAYRDEMERRFQAAFGFDRRRFKRDKGRGGGRPRAIPAAGLPAAGARQPVALLQRRQEQVLIATLVNHPRLLHEHAEELAGIALSGADLDRLRRLLLDLAAEDQGLDSVEIRRHLREVTDERTAKALEDRDLYRLWPFAEPGATFQDAQTGLRHLMDLYRARTAVNETADEGRRFAETMDQQGLARLEAKQKAVHDCESRRAEFDRTDKISGLPETS